MATTTAGQIWVGTLGPEVFLKVEGRATHAIAPALRRCLTELEASGARSFRLDLGGCTYVDSTFLGVLAGACLRLRDRPNTQFTLSAISPRCMEGLRTLGVDRFCHLATDSVEPPHELHQLPVPREMGETWADVVLEAHQALVQVDAANAERFDDVIRMVSESLSRSPHRSAEEDDSANRRIR